MTGRYKRKPKPKSDWKEKAQEVKDTLEDDVAAYLAKGGNVQVIEPCSVEHANQKNYPPHAVKCKDGKTRLYRNTFQRMY